MAFIGLHPVTREPIFEAKSPEAEAKGPEPADLVPKLAEAEVDAKGTVTARICTFGVVDLDGDVVNAGAFGKTPQEVIVSPWNHGSYGTGHDSLPVGVGIVRAEGNHGVFRGRLLLETSAGRDVYEVLKAMGGRCQWSWGFVPVKSHRGRLGGKPVRYLDAVVVSEVSPVISAASIGTGTVELRGKGEQQLELERMARELQRAPVADVARTRRAGRNDLEIELARAVGLGVRV